MNDAQEYLLEQAIEHAFACLGREALLSNYPTKAGVLREGLTQAVTALKALQKLETSKEKAA